MAKQFLDSAGLATFFTQLKGLFATKDAVAEVKTNTDPYIFDIDYDTVLKFNTNQIVSGEASSAMLGAGTLGTMILGSS